MRGARRGTGGRDATRGRAVAAIALGAAAFAIAASATPLTAAPPAYAHNQVVATSPDEDGSVDTQPGTVSLTTSDALLDFPESTALQVTGPDGRHYETGCPAIDDVTLSAPADLGPAGEYTVAYQFVSADGHPTGGEFAFEWAPAAGEPAAQGSDEPACAVTASTSDAAISTAAPLDEAEPAVDAGDLLWLAGGAVAVIGAAVVTWLVARRRAPGADPDASDPERASGP